jgi:hypothetical protein
VFSSTCAPTMPLFRKGLLTACMAHPRARAIASYIALGDSMRHDAVIRIRIV